jgi:hypothetical protein
MTRPAAQKLAVVLHRTIAPNKLITQADIDVIADELIEAMKVKQVDVGAELEDWLKGHNIDPIQLAELCPLPEHEPDAKKSDSKKK